MKSCTRCKTEKELDQFRKSVKSPDGLMSICRDCDSERKRGWCRRYKEKQKEIFNQVYGGKVDCKCPKCGKIHKVEMIWIGNGMPRKFCDGCKWFPENYVEQHSTPLRADMLWRS